MKGSSTKSSRLPWAYLLGLMMLALAFRVQLLAGSDWLLDGDDSLSALMALKIPDGDRPIMLKNQPYAGAWEPYAMAASFQVFGVSRPAAKLPVLAASVMLVLTTWLLASEAAGPTAGRFAAALAGFPPLYILVLSLKPFAPYVETALLGSLALWSATRLAFRPDQRRGVAWALGCGVASGAAMWMHPLAVEYLIPAGLLVLLRLRGARLARVTALGVAGFFLGGMPIWIYNLRTDGATAQFILGGVRGQAADRLAVLAAWWNMDLPRGAGLWQPWGPSPRDLSVALAVLLIAAVGWAMLLPRPPGRRTRPIDAVLLTLATIPVVSMLSGFGSLVLNPWGFDATGRYTLPLWGSLAVIVGAFAAAVSGWRRSAGLAVGGFVLATNLFGSFEADPVRAFQSPYWTKLPADNGPLLATLKAEGISCVWMNHWAGFPVMFDARAAGQSLITYDWYDVQAGGIDRFPEYLPLVEQADRAAFALVTDESDSDLERRLRALGVSYRRRDVPPYVLVIPASRGVHPSEVTDALDYHY